MAKWEFTKGLHEVGNGLYAYLLPDGGWCWSNTGLIVDGDESILIDTLFDLPMTADMLDTMRDAIPASDTKWRVKIIFSDVRGGLKPDSVVGRPCRR